MLSAGDRAPDFDLPDLAGRRHRLEDALQRGPALAVFWKSGCNTCDLAFSYLQRLAVAYPEGRWQLLAISQDGAQASEEFARQHGLTFPILIEGEGWPVSQQYDPDATPAQKFLTFLHEIAGHVGAWMFTPFRNLKREEAFVRAIETSARRILTKHFLGNPPH